jgi:hypothetical protein
MVPEKTRTAPTAAARRGDAAPPADDEREARNGHAGENVRGAYQSLVR